MAWRIILGGNEAVPVRLAADQWPVSTGGRTDVEEENALCSFGAPTNEPGTSLGTLLSVVLRRETGSGFVNCEFA